MQQTTLATAQLGRAGLEITRIGFGAWAIGGVPAATLELTLEDLAEIAAA